MPRKRLATGILLALALLLFSGESGRESSRNPVSTGANEKVPVRDGGAAPSRVIAARADRAGQLAGPPPEYAPQRILVKFAPDAAPATVERIIAGIGGESIKTFRAPGLVLVALPDGVSISDAEEYFERQDDVERVERDLVYRLLDVPDDPSFSELWGLDNSGQDGGVADVDINAPEAWIETRGSRDFVIGVVDSGVQLDHPDLQANLWVNPGEIPDNGIDDDGNGYVDDIHGIDQISFDGTPDDDLGHGTHVAGTIAAVGNNGVGVTGVMWDAEILACKVFSSFGWTTLSRILTCLEYYVWAKDSGVDVVAINNSWGDGGFSWSLYDVIGELEARDILFVASAGNSAVDLDELPRYPAAYEFDNVLSVAAIDRRGELASFSNYGATSVDIAAPGVDVFSTEWRSGYGYKSGTSMSAPHATGAVGLIQASAPSFDGQQIKAHLLATGVADPALESITLSGRRLRLELPFIDLDGDLISDRWERRYGLDPADPADAASDPDADGLD
ncbi:MAG: S8 family peptidase, partial [Woeseiaceae bacterium]